MCVCVFYVCVCGWLSVFGSTLIGHAMLIACSLCCSLVQFHTQESHAAGQQLLLHCPERVYVCAYVCDWARFRQDPLACWLGILSYWWEPVGVGSWTLFFPVASCPCVTHTPRVYTFVSHALIPNYILQYFWSFSTAKVMKIHALMINFWPPPSHTQIHTQMHTPYLMASVVAACSAQASEEED